MKLTDIERQALSYIADHPDGRAMVCEPHLCGAIRGLLFQTPALLSDVYSMPGGGYIARITEAGRDALKQKDGGNG
jgi:hypothetical protein